MYDFGCGDGRNTERLADLFKPNKITGVEKCESLVKRFRKNHNLNLKRFDLQKVIPGEFEGKLATVWGVFHHLDNKKALLDILSKFSYIFIREPLKGLDLFELGKPLTREGYEKLFSRFENKRKYVCKKDFFLFAKNLV